MTGTVYLVGAGPGAPDLITVRGAAILRRAEIVLYDALVHPDTVALADAAKKVAVGKRCHRHSTAQRFINKQLIDAAQKYGTVVRLKGGDPILFGRAQEEINALKQAGVAFQVIPGVTSALAAAERGRIAESDLEKPALILVGEAFRAAQVGEDREETGSQDDFIAYGNSWFR